MNAATASAVPQSLQILILLSALLDTFNSGRSVRRDSCRQDGHKAWLGISDTGQESFHPHLQHKQHEERLLGGEGKRVNIKTRSGHRCLGDNLGPPLALHSDLVEPCSVWRQANGSTNTELTSISEAIRHCDLCSNNSPATPYVSPVTSVVPESGVRKIGMSAMLRNVTSIPARGCSGSGQEAGRGVGNAAH